MNEVFATNANIQRDRKNTSLSPVLSVGALKKKKKACLQTNTEMGGGRWIVLPKSLRKCLAGKHTIQTENGIFFFFPKPISLPLSSTPKLACCHVIDAFLQAPFSSVPHFLSFLFWFSFCLLSASSTYAFSSFSILFTVLFQCPTLVCFFLCCLQCLLLTWSFCMFSWGALDKIFEEVT